MVISILSRKTGVRDQDELEKRRQRALERVRVVLERQPGFVEVTIELAEGGSLRETTRWRSSEDCRRYVRGGGAAMVATISDAILPTASYPNGAWIRETREE